MIALAVIIMIFVITIRRGVAVPLFVPVSIGVMMVIMASTRFVVVVSAEVDFATRVESSSVVVAVGVIVLGVEAAASRSRA